MKYEKPIVVENKETVEGVYALDSGGIPEYTADIIWTNHNSGSHSDLAVKIKTGNKAGEYMRIEAVFVGKGNIESIGGFSGGYTSVDFSHNKIVFTRSEHFNPNENFEFGFNNVVFDSNGDGHDETIHRGSYYQGQGTGYLGSAIVTGDFVLNVILN